jgi:predicted dehydrogenase
MEEGTVTTMLVVGLQRGAAWARAALETEDIRVTGLVDLDRAKLDRIGAELGVPPERRFEDFGRALDVDADVVVLAVPTPLHREMSLAALRAGHHVICEKPLAATLDEGRALRAEVATLDRRLMIGEQYRFADCVENMRRAVLAGMVGQPAYLSHEFFRQAGSARADAGNHWAHQPDSAIAEMSVHHFDMWWRITGKRPTRVLVQGFNPEWQPPGRRFGHSMLATLEDGLHVHYITCLARHRAQTTWHGTITIVGDEGALTMDGRTPTVTFSRALPSAEPRVQQLAVGPVSYVDRGTVGMNTTNLMVRELMDAVREGRPHQCDPTDNWPSFATEVAATESSRRGAWVDVALD